MLFNKDFSICGQSQKEFAQHFPDSGWVEHDPMDIWRTTLETSKEVIANAGITSSDIAAIGITNQRETTLIWDRKTGLPIYNAIVWQDRRTAALCNELKRLNHEALVSERTGLLLDPYFSATKIAWILDNIPNARQRAERGELAFGTVDTWLLWNLTDGQSHATDAPTHLEHYSITFTVGNGMMTYSTCSMFRGSYFQRLKTVRPTLVALNYLASQLKFMVLQETNTPPL